MKSKLLFLIFLLPFFIYQSYSQGVGNRTSVGLKAAGLDFYIPYNVSYGDDPNGQPIEFKNEFQGVFGLGLNVKYNIIPALFIKAEGNYTTSYSYNVPDLFEFQENPNYEFSSAIFDGVFMLGANINPSNKTLAHIGVGIVLRNWLNDFPQSIVNFQDSINGKNAFEGADQNKETSKLGLRLEFGVETFFNDDLSLDIGLHFTNFQPFGAFGAEKLGFGIGNESFAGVSLGLNYYFTGSNDIDGDGLTYSDEVEKYKTKPDVADTDEDKLNDGQEVFGTRVKIDTIRVDGVVLAILDTTYNYTSDPKSPDSDKDGINDFEEVFIYKTDPMKDDSDGDKVIDLDEIKGFKTKKGSILLSSPLLYDSDGDGLDDFLERQNETNPLKRDTDEDGLDDSTEVARGFNPLISDRDTDGDGLTDIYERDTLRSDPFKIDTDEDGLTDGEEKNGVNSFGMNGAPIRRTTLALVKDSDNDGLLDGEEVKGVEVEVNDKKIKYFSDPNSPDSDGDGLLDYDELKVYFTNPLSRDTDIDNLPDNIEVMGWSVDYGGGRSFLYKSNPNLKDTDGDGLADDKEKNYRTNPESHDTDNDGLNDLEEIDRGLSPYQPSTFEYDFKFLWAWAGGGGVEPKSQLVIDKQSNFYLVGSLSGFDGKRFGSKDTSYKPIFSGEGDEFEDFFISKFDSQGTLKWVRRGGGVGRNHASCVDIDSAGNLYAGGSFNSPAQVENGFGMNSYGDRESLSGRGGVDAFVIKLDSDGQILWKKSIGGSTSEYIKDIVFGPDGFVYIAGIFSSGLSIDGVDGFPINLNSSGQANSFIAKLDPSTGMAYWAKKIASKQEVRVEALTVNNRGNLFVAGNFEGSAEFDYPDDSLSSRKKLANQTFEMEDIFVSKFDNNGHFIDAVSFGGQKGDNAFAMECDSSGSVFLTGSFKSVNCKFGTKYINSKGGEDIFVACLNNNLSVDWIQSFGSIGKDEARALFVNTKSDGNLYLTGTFSHDVKFNETTQISTIGGDKNNDIIVLVLDSKSGNFITATKAGSSNLMGTEDIGYSIAVDSNKDIIISGYSFGAAVFGSDIKQQFTVEGSDDGVIFITKIFQGEPREVNITK